MHPWFRVGHVWVVCLALGLVDGNGVSGAQPDKEIGRLANAYRGVRSEFERRAVCLDAIDAGVIAPGHSVAVVDALFGTTTPRSCLLQAAAWRQGS
jgi:hypothetical protein